MGEWQVALGRVRRLMRRHWNDNIRAYTIQGRMYSYWRMAGMDGASCTRKPEDRVPRSGAFTVFARLVGVPVFNCRILQFCTGGFARLLGNAECVATDCLQKARHFAPWKKLEARD
jgi:hypothetical protein